MHILIRSNIGQHYLTQFTHAALLMLDRNVLVSCREPQLDLFSDSGLERVESNSLVCLAELDGESLSALFAEIGQVSKRFLHKLGTRFGISQASTLLASFSLEILL